MRRERREAQKEGRRVNRALNLYKLRGKSCVDILWNNNFNRRKSLPETYKSN